MATITVNSSKTYSSDGKGNTFRFEWKGWTAVITGTNSKDVLDFSGYSDFYYTYFRISRDGNDAVGEFCKETVNSNGERNRAVVELIGTVRIKNYFTVSDKISTILMYNYDKKTVENFYVFFGNNNNTNIVGTAGRDLIITGSGTKTVDTGEEGDVIEVGLGPSDYSVNDFTGEVFYSGEIASGTQTINAGAGNDKIWVDAFSNSGGHTINGEDGDDEIYAVDDLYARNNILNGGSGDDRLEAYGTDHIMDGGTGNDYISVYGSNNTLNGGDGNDTLKIVSGDNNKLYGGNGADTLYGGEGNDYLSGGDGSDKLYGGKGADKLYGGDGADKLYGGDGKDTLYGNGDNDTLYGNAGDDTLYGQDGNDSLYGQDGDDTLSGGEGNDTLNGGAGNDLFVYADGSGNDTITDYTAGEDTLKVFSGSISSSALANSDKDVKFTAGKGSITLKNAADKSVSLQDSRGKYTVSQTKITLDKGFDGVMDSAAFFGTVATIDGQKVTKSLTVKGNATANTVYGGSAGDKLYGYGGTDKLYGYGENDTLYGGDGADKLYGGDGKDTLYGNVGSDTLYGNAGNDALYGQEGNDSLYGQDGDDTLSGGAGNDTLNGGEGNDKLTGGSGKDIFFFASQTLHGNDIIGDYGAGDTIAFANKSMYTGEYEFSNNDVILHYADGDEGTIKIVGGRGMTVSFLNGPYKTHTFN